MAKPDKVFKQAHDWFREAVTQALSSVPAGQQAAVEKLVALFESKFGEEE